MHTMAFSGPKGFSLVISIQFGCFPESLQRMFHDQKLFQPVSDTEVFGVRRTVCRHCIYCSWSVWVAVCFYVV